MQCVLCLVVLMNLAPILTTTATFFSFRATAPRTQNFLFQSKQVVAISPKVRFLNFTQIFSLHKHSMICYKYEKILYTFWIWPD